MPAFNTINTPSFTYQLGDKPAKWFLVICLFNVFHVLQTTHMDYIVASANLYAQTYGIKGTRDRGEIARTLQTVSVPDFTPRSSMRIHTTDEEMQNDKQGVGEWNNNFTGKMFPG